MSPPRHGFHFYNTLLFVYWLLTVWLKCSGLCLTKRNQLSHTLSKTIEGRMRSASHPTQGAVKPSLSSRPLNSFGWCGAWKSKSQSSRRQWVPCSLPCPSLSGGHTIVWVWRALLGELIWNSILNLTKGLQDWRYDGGFGFDRFRKGFKLNSSEKRCFFPSLLFSFLSLQPCESLESNLLFESLDLHFLGALTASQGF